MDVEFADVKNILTRTSGYLTTVASHSVQPYRGCTLGRSLCGVGCYVQHFRHVTQGRPWGGFLEVREGAGDSYLRNAARERRWARSRRGKFGIFLSSSTEPFLPQESRYRVTRRLLEAMLDEPPDVLILQTHSHRVLEYVELYRHLQTRCAFRVHISIETDRETIDGLPPHASSVERRLAAAAELESGGIQTVITVSPLLPIENPHGFFRRVAEAASVVVIDHFIEGDGSPDGSRTRRTPLVEAIARLEPRAVELAYRDEIVTIAQEYLPGRVGVSIDGFAGRYLPAP